MIVLKNNAQSILSQALASDGTSIVLHSGDGSLFPSHITGFNEYYYASISDNAGNVEYVKVTNRNSDTLTIVRAQEGTTAQSWAVGSRVQLRMTAKTWEDMASYFWTRVTDDSNTTLVPTVATTTKFTVSGDRRSILQSNRTYRLYKSDGTFEYGQITTASYSNSVTTVTVSASTSLSGTYLGVDVGFDMSLIPSNSTYAPANHTTDTNAHSTLLAALEARINTTISALTTRVAALEATHIVTYS